MTLQEEDRGRLVDVLGYGKRTLVPKAELLPSISPGKASIGAGLNSLFKGICFGG